MRQICVELKPFPSFPSGDFRIEALCQLKSPSVFTQWTLHGPWQELLWNPDVKLHELELWKSTCFEMFLGPVSSPEYWEWNFHPNGISWGFHHFTSYRSSAEHPWEAIQNLEFKTEKNKNFLRFSSQWQAIGSSTLAYYLESSTDLQMNLCSILQSRTNPAAITYWAPSHEKEKADFHQRANWLNI